MLAQRLDSLCCGYEDLTDHKTLRGDVLMQTAGVRNEPVASAPTFSRLEYRATRTQARASNGVLIEQLIASPLHQTRRRWLRWVRERGGAARLLQRLTCG